MVIDILQMLFPQIWVYIRQARGNKCQCNQIIHLLHLFNLLKKDLNCQDSMDIHLTGNNIQMNLCHLHIMHQFI